MEAGLDVLESAKYIASKATDVVASQEGVLKAAKRVSHHFMP